MGHRAMLNGDNAENTSDIFRCSNSFGESLLHLACRRGRTEMVRFLLLDVDHEDEKNKETPADTSISNDGSLTARRAVSIRDDFRKNPMHDACWTVHPNFDLLHLLLEHAPELILMEDSRGNTPFDYAREEHYGVWLKFLWERRGMLRCL